MVGQMWRGVVLFIYPQKNKVVGHFCRISNMLL